MPRPYLFNLFFLSLAVSSIMEASECETCVPDCAQHEFTIGPQWFYLTRKRAGGIKQTGQLYGGYFTYERIKRYGWYVGAEGSYAEGSLKGKLSDGAGNLHSKFTDAWIEGRFGYTFQQKEGRRFSFTPYVGVGYAVEKNNFNRSSPLHIHFKTQFYYPSAGFRGSFCVNENITVGINFRARIPYEPKCKVSHDPDNDSIHQKIGEKLQYRVELPITYSFPCYQPWGITIMPFYEYRPYGTHVNHPFDYFKTTLSLWGVGVGASF